MKTAKPPAPEGAAGSSRRAQPVRQARINPPRTSSLNRANPLAGAPQSEQPINILPGVTHFADAITALPKELVRHFTLLKEVDAKIFAPEAALFQLLDQALNSPPPDFTRPLDDASNSAAPVPMAPASAQINSTGLAHFAPLSARDARGVYDPANIPRRTLFRDTALKIQEMLVSLEEKNHVIATANDALQKQLARIEDIWPHLETEFSDEAKWGSTTHWAYIDNRQAKTNDKQTERSRREGAATLSAAAQQLADEAASRSSDRKQAMAAKKNSKNQAADADGDKTQDTGKKATGGGKSRKPLPDSAAPVGLGITPAPPGSGSAPSKRRKTENAKTNGGTPTERATGSALNNSASKQRTTSPRETPAPDGGNKKRKALPTSSNQAKKSRTNATMSPSVASSPVIGTLPDPVKAGHGSPAPSAASTRPASSRARRNSTQSSDNARQRPPSAPSNKPNSNPPGTPDPGHQSNGAKANTDAKSQKETAGSAPNKAGQARPEGEDAPQAPEPAQNGSKESAPGSGQEREPSKKEPTSLAIQPPPSSTVKTKSGRASKPSTPATATFAEAGPTAASNTTSSSRSRQSRNAESNASTATSHATAASGNTTSTTKRSHKRGASISAGAGAQAAQQAASAAEKEKEKDKDKDKEKERDATGKQTAQQQQNQQQNQQQAQQQQVQQRQQQQQQQQQQQKREAENDAAARDNRRGKEGETANDANDDVDVDEEEEEDDDEPAGEDEPLYCYCNQVSYGEMVACDGDDCPREWFHLECVGLKVAPKSNAKWYCEDCKKRLRNAERR